MGCHHAHQTTCYAKCCIQCHQFCLSCSLLIVNRLCEVSPALKCKPNVICHSSLKQEELGVINLQCCNYGHLLSDFSANLTVFLWFVAIANHVRQFLAQSNGQICMWCWRCQQEDHMRHVEVIWFLFHVLQLLLIRFTQQNSCGNDKSMMKHMQKLD